MTNLETARALAVQHAANLTADIVNASTRIEHIRLTRLAEEAHAVVDALTDSPEESSASLLPTHW